MYTYKYIYIYGIIWISTCIVPLMNALLFLRLCLFQFFWHRDIKKVRHQIEHVCFFPKPRFAEMLWQGQLENKLKGELRTTHWWVDMLIRGIYIHPWKPPWNLKMNPWKKRFPTWEPAFFRCKSRLFDPMLRGLVRWRQLHHLQLSSKRHEIHDGFFQP